MCGAIAVATWDDPQVLLREMEGCRLPLANIVEPTLVWGAYDTLSEVFKNTPDGYLALTRPSNFFSIVYRLHFPVKQCNYYYYYY